MILERAVFHLKMGIILCLTREDNAMNIKKQIRSLYFYEIISGLQIVDAVWVFFLLERGFSLTQVGIAEGVFHGVSMCFEIPSGMISDTLGRRRTLMAAGLMSAVSALCMLVSGNFFLILVSMGLNAISYNLVSGTREALTYDSLLEVGQQERYLMVSSRQDFIYQGMFALTSLMSLVTVTLGYEKSYLLAVFRGLLCFFAAAALTEARIKPGTGHEIRTDAREAAEIDTKRKADKRNNGLGLLFREIGNHFLQALKLLRNHKIVAGRMSLVALISSGDYIVYMMLQEHLVAVGLSPEFLGIPLLMISLCTMAGALLAEKTAGLSLKKVSMIGGLGGGIFLALSGGNSLILCVLAAGAAHCLGEVTVLRMESENQKNFESSFRATMVSVGSMFYSIVMTVLSPISGLIAEKTSMLGAFLCLGILTALGALYFILSGLSEP